jgi:pyruvate/2-oxoglutarate dehydrogenase complex dihydrolipoamide dehydrogenase (E3) component
MAQAGTKASFAIRTERGLKQKMSQHFDCIIIGSGQAANPLAHDLGEAGLSTAVIEHKHVGGTCINEGCTPTKTMVASARVAYLARRGGDYGVKGCSVSLDMQRVRKRKRDIVDSFRNGSQKRLEQTKNVELIFGHGSFTGPKEVRVVLNAGGQRTLTADRIFINTGTRASVPSLAGLDRVQYLNNASIMELDTVPEHLLVLGGGYIGVEFGQMFRRFGSHVTIVHSRSQLLNREDPDLAEEVAKTLQEDGIEILLNAKAQQVKLSGSTIELAVLKDGERQTLSGSHLLVATGRIPNADKLDLQNAGVDTENGFIKVNSRLETSAQGVYALGDVKGGPAFTHISYDDYRIIRGNLLQKKNLTTDHRMVPYVVFMDPQLGRIGMSETEARANKIKFRVAKMPMNYVARARETDEPRGFMKALVDSESEQILGAAVLGLEGGEIMSILEVAMMGKLPYTTLRDGTFAHPTLAESLNNLFSQFDQC